MTKENIKSKKGFTIIEVVLVLAIAGLIFLMVFIGLPALQRSQRDTQRRDDMARFMSQLSQYQANNGGEVPSLEASSYNGTDTKTGFIKDYLLAGKDSFADPSTGTTYHVKDVKKCENGNCPNLTKTKAGGSDNYDAMGEIVIYSNATCKGEDPEWVQGDRKIALTIKLEGAGVYCGHK